LKSLFCSGSSMRPLLSPGDVVLCSALPFQLVRKGDVVVVRPGDGQALVIHRVVRMMPDGRLVTRGDRCPEADPDPVGPGEYVCRAVARERGYGRARPVYGGRAGFLQAAVCMALHRARKAAGRALPSPRAPAVRIARALWRPRIELLTTNGVHGPETRFVHRGRTVARWIPALDAFHCRKLYTLVLDRPRTGKGGREP